jgi:hypothetical protein
LQGKKILGSKKLEDMGTALNKMNNPSEETTHKREKAEMGRVTGSRIDLE